MTADALAAAIRKADRVFVCGNGGSAANCLHFCNDLVACGIDARALTGDVATLTAIANDYSFEEIFSRQLEVFAAQDDLLIVLSGSGNSKNILRALGAAMELDLTTWGILGNNGGHAASLCDDVILTRPGMQESEEDQLVIGHRVRAILMEKKS